MVLFNFLQWLRKKKPFQPVRRSSRRNSPSFRLGIEQLEDRVLLTGPDLTLLAATAPITARLGDNISIAWTVVNNGSQTANPPWYDAVYLSRDPVFDNSDLYVTANYASNSVSSLAPGSNYSVSQNVALPVDSDAGGAYLLFKTDTYSQVQEDDETNNVKAVPITLTAPNVDLVITASSAPTSVNAGGTASVSWTVANQGSESTTEYWYDEIYLSSDSTFDPQTDTYLD